MTVWICLVWASQCSLLYRWGSRLRLRVKVAQQNLHSHKVFFLQVQFGLGWSCWPGGESQHVPVSKQFSDKSKAKGSKITSLFPSLSYAVHPSTPWPLPPLLTPTPFSPLPQPPLQFLWGTEGPLFVQLRASSQEISCDGNSGETSCWLGHCRGLITWATPTSKPQLPRRVGCFSHFSQSLGGEENARKCREDSGASRGWHFLEAKSYSCDQ